MLRAKQLQPKIITLNRFEGIDNVHPPEKSTGLQAIENLFVTDDNQLFTRQGYALKVTCTPHSLWSDGNICLYREGVYLKRLMNDLTSTSILRSNLSGNNNMQYLSLAGRVYYTDGISTGIVDNGSDRTWGLDIPDNPIISSIAGTLQEGRYQVAITFLRNDGQESGASDASSIDLSNNSGISIALPTSSDSTVSMVNIYVTGQNGEVLFYVISLANGTSSFNYTSNATTNTAIETQFLNKPIPGKLIEFHNSRVFIVNGNIVWYTNSFAYELVDYSDNYLVEARNITMFSAVTDGIWVGTTDETLFFEGHSIPYRRVFKSDSGVIPGSAVTISGNNLSKDPNFSYNGPAVIWGSSKYGVCAGLDGGTMLNLTKEKYLLPINTIQGTGFVRKETDNSRLYTLSIYN